MNLAALETQAREIIQRYDEPRAAVLPLLWLVQENFGHISSEAEFWVGRLVEVAVSHVREVVSFYSMFRTKAAGRRELRVCTSLPCLLRGAEDVLAQLKDQLKISPGETTPGGELTLTEVECLCACEIAPMAQLDKQFVGPLNGAAGTLEAIVREALAAPAARIVCGGVEPFISTDGPVLSTRFNDTEGAWWDTYVAGGGYLAAKKALFSITPAQIIDEVSRANLRGLGGA
ncbi:MAG: NAD(P)H-dependent oxidoreductase subunit E, partial [Acidobacteria bacterium]|nr:NAD(P)H-dependent oxidoreductase subunit E [Acidobacteriota bacterium]